MIKVYNIGPTPDHLLPDQLRRRVEAHLPEEKRTERGRVKRRKIRSQIKSKMGILQLNFYSNGKMKTFQLGSKRSLSG